MKAEPGRARWIIVGVALAVLVLAGIGAWLVVALPRRARSAEQRRALEPAIASFHAQRWERPVLRGEPVAGNAFDAQLAAMQRPLSSLDSAAFDDLSDRLVAGEPASPELVALLEEHADALARYRASTRHTWSWGDYRVEGGLGAEEISVGAHLRVSRLLAVAATRASPRECVELATDLVRLGQDRAAGRSIVVHMLHGVVVNDVFAVLPRCLVEGDADVRAQAARELGVLARHSAPIGHALELEALSAGAMFREVLEPLDRFPTDAIELECWWTASDALDAWEELARDPAAHRGIGDDYPADIRAFEALERAIGASRNPLLAIAAPGFSRYLTRDAATRTQVRLLWAMARLLAGEPRSILSEEALYDETTGRPLVHRRLEDGGVELRSAGVDGRWGGGSAEHPADDLILRVPNPQSE